MYLGEERKLIVNHHQSTTYCTIKIRTVLYIDEKHEAFWPVDGMFSGKNELCR